MTQYTKPTVLPAWAESGDTVQPTNPEIQNGWPNSSVPPSRQRFNWVLNWASNAVRYFMQRGIPTWDSAEDYPAGARVQKNNATYIALLGSGNVNQDPEAPASTFWERWGFSISELFGFIDAHLSKSVAGSSNVTLTAAEARASVITLTGAITANIQVIVPASVKRWNLINSTTGNFTVTVKTPSGTGVVMQQGFNSAIRCDGTNVVNNGASNTPGTLLRTTVYNRIAGTQNVIVDGAAPTTTGAGTFTPLATTTAVVIEVLGGGGGGGGCAAQSAGNNAASAGGGGGAYGVGRFTSSFSGITITVGTAGAAGAAGANPGSTGGTSSAGVLITASGGPGSPAGVSVATSTTAFASSVSGGSGVSGSNLYAFAGGVSERGFLLASSQGGGAGGASGMGGGGNSSPGAGGQGISVASGGSAAAGLAGNSGLVIIKEYA